MLVSNWRFKFLSGKAYVVRAGALVKAALTPFSPQFSLSSETRRIGRSILSSILYENTKKKERRPASRSYARGL